MRQKNDVDLETDGGVDVNVDDDHDMSYDTVRATHVYNI
jgi:hypothetical protein